MKVEQNDNMRTFFTTQELGNAHFMTRRRLEHLRRDMQYWTKEIESTARAINQELEKVKNRKWWRMTGLVVVNYDYALQSITRSYESALAALKAAKKIAEKIENEPLFYKIIREIF